MAEPHVAMSHFHLVRSPLSANYVLIINHMTKLLKGKNALFGCVISTLLQKLIKSEFPKPKSEFVTEMSKNNRFRINGLSRDPGSMNFGTLLKRHPKYGLLQSHLKLELSSTCFLSVTGTYQERFSLEA